VNNYQSPFSNRYATDEMREIWGHQNRQRQMQLSWLHLLYEQAVQGVVKINPQDVSETMANVRDGTFFMVDQEVIDELESKCHHNTVAELIAFKNRLNARGITWGNYLHMGVTSSDIEDMADLAQIWESADLLVQRNNSLLFAMGERIKEWEDLIVLGRTHLQPAEPTLLGFRFAVYAQELMNVGFPLYDRRGWYGAVGTGANLSMIGFNQGGTDLCFQTYPRVKDLRFLFPLVDWAATLSKMALDIRLMCMSGWMSIKRGKEYVGSSAMPGKNNPIEAERICSLARKLPSYFREIWDCAANSALERTLDDSAIRRMALPEAFLTMDELFTTMLNMLNKILVDRYAARVEFDNNSQQFRTSRSQTLAQLSGVEYAKTTSHLGHIPLSLERAKSLLNKVINQIGSRHA
jgi:adenylosuccinate lyase